MLFYKNVLWKLNYLLLSVHGKVPSGQFPLRKLPPGKPTPGQLAPRIIPTRKIPTWKILTQEKPLLPGRLLPADSNPTCNFDSIIFFPGKLPAAD